MEFKYKNKIVATKDSEGRIEVKVEGLWNGKERLLVGRKLRKAIQKAKYKLMREYRQADKERKEKEALEKKTEKDDALKNFVEESVEEENKETIIEEKEKCPKTKKKKKKITLKLKNSKRK